MSLDSVNYLLFKLWSGISPSVTYYNLRANIRELQAVLKKIFSDMNYVNLFTQKFHMLDHVAKSKSKSGLLNYLDATFHKHIDFVAEAFIRL